MAHALDGVREKLTRANENICALGVEIDAFLKERPEGGFSSDKHQAANEFVRFHAHREIPQRFGVIAGEIVHHLRSSLDHVAWLLSEETYRQTKETAIGFPIFTEQPTRKDEIKNYSRKVNGIKSGSALKLIESVQPYHAVIPMDDPLALVHELDRIDKHQNLVLVVASMDMRISYPLALTQSLAIGGLGMDEDAFVKYFESKVQMQISNQIAFAKFGSGRNQNVIPALTVLVSAVRDVVELFSSEVS